MRHLRCLFVALLSLWAPVAEAADRVALVIGNSVYEAVPALPNPANDASDIAAALERLGFEVTLGLNLDYRGMRLALRDFSAEAADSDMAIVYFAGHGIEIAKTNYLIPVNAELNSDRDVDFEAIALDTVLASIRDAPGLRVVLVDACRNNPFVPSMSRTVASRSLGRGLGRIDPVGGVLVGYAAREGTVALDGEGRNSPYAQALLEHLEEPGLEIGKLFRRVRDTVYDLTDGQQEPFTYGSLPGEDIYLKPPEPATGTLLAHAEDAGIAAAFVEAERTDTLAGWTRFIDRYGGNADNALVGFALRRRDALVVEKENRTRAPWLRPDAPHGRADLDLTREERRLIQTALSYMGHYRGPVDGAFGPMTRRAITEARFANDLPPGDYVDYRLLQRLPDVPAIDAMSSRIARSYRDVALPAAMEPRLQAALDVMGERQVVFGYFRGSLYLAGFAKSSESGWYNLNQLARRVGGHLATVSSAEENSFIHDLFSRDQRFVTSDASGSRHGPMIGLYQPPGSVEPGGGWAWVTGEPLAYTNWSPGNPDNYLGGQSYAGFFRPPKPPRGDPRVIWWDDNSGWHNRFVIEIE